MEVQRIPKRTVSVIEPQKSILVDKEKYHQKRVAAYCRVSTDSEEQLTSYQNQTRVYTEMIAANKEWEFAGLYADEGISGTRADKRPEFQRMIRDCQNGKIDYTQPEKPPASAHTSTQVELDEILNTQPLDEDAARSLICKLAQEQYDTIGNKEYETERLRRLFTAFECTAELNAELLQSAVSAVLVTRQTVRLQLKNGQIIGKDDLV